MPSSPTSHTTTTYYPGWSQHGHQGQRWYNHFGIHYRRLWASPQLLLLVRRENSTGLCPAVVSAVEIPYQLQLFRAGRLCKALDSKRRVTPFTSCTPLDQVIFLSPMSHGTCFFSPGQQGTLALPAILSTKHRRQETRPQNHKEIGTSQTSPEKDKIQQSRIT